MRCINALGGPRGLQHPEASVRQISVDLLGLIAAQLYKDALSAEENQAWLLQFAATDGELRQHVLQLYLAHTLAVLSTDFLQTSLRRDVFCAPPDEFT